MPLAHRIEFGRGIIGWVAEHGQYLLANDVRKEPRFFAAHMTATLSELAVPVRLGGDVVAVINVESDRVDAFDDGDLLALDGIAAQVASAIRNARLFEEKVRALRNLEILQDITNVLNSDLDLDALLERIARRSVEAVRPAQMGAVLLYDAGLPRRALELRLRRRQPRCGRVRMDFHEGLPGSVFVSGQGRLVALGPGRLRPARRRLPGGRGRHRAPQRAVRPDLAAPGEAGRPAPGERDLARTPSTARTCASPPPWPTRPPSPSATRCACSACWRWTASARPTSRTSATSCARRSPSSRGTSRRCSPGVGADQAHQYLRIAQDQSQKLGRMIEEVLEVARLEHGVAQRHLEWGPVALAQTVRLVVKTLRQDAALKDVAVNAQPRGRTCRRSPATSGCCSCWS